MRDLDPGMFARLQHRSWHEIALPIGCELGHIDLSPIHLYSGGLDRWVARPFWFPQTWSGRCFLLKLVLKFIHKTQNRPGAGFAEGANGATLDVVRDMLEIFRILRAPFAVSEPM